ncbi:hypothetical protein [Deinococcus frigens]|uniref:hypothetical protein n=1 Tax=Deinococcus frigens TaxID=249403 RepID=UPI0004954D53|nr:hypothetical protein [Deinococcus frigens]
MSRPTARASRVGGPGRSELWHLRHDKTPPRGLRIQRPGVVKRAEQLKSPLPVQQIGVLFREFLPALPRLAAFQD